MLTFGIPQSVADLFESCTGPEIRALTEKIVGAIRDEKVKLRPSLKQMHEGLMEAKRRNQNMTEAIASGVFNVVTQNLVISGVMDGYGTIQRVGRSLVTEIATPNEESGKIVGFTEEATIEQVREGEEYKAAGFTDKYVTFENKKFGRHIPLTKEAIQFDKTGQVLDRARTLGVTLAEHEEETILKTIMDLTDYRAYYPAGTQTALYSTTAGESVNQTPKNNQQINALADWTDIDNSNKLLASKKKENGKPIPLASDNAILVPYALAATAEYVTKNTADTRSNIPAGSMVPQRIVVPGGTWASPFLDANSATEWYYGSFKRQFVLTRVWGPLTEWIAGQGQVSMMLRDIFGTYLVSTFFGVRARDFRFVVKNTAS